MRVVLVIDFQQGSKPLINIESVFPAQESKFGWYTHNYFWQPQHPGTIFIIVIPIMDHTLITSFF